MKLHTVFVTYNRLELTKQAIQSYLDTVTVPFTLVVMDNGSTDGTADWVRSRIHPEWSMAGMEVWVHEFFENMYPGYATNFGWSRAFDDATHLHRADNDFKFLPGWCDEVEARFDVNPRLGQLGLRTGDEELWVDHNTGGNCVIRRELWDEGIRWDERPWPEIKPAGYTEDSYFSPEVIRMGWEWGRVTTPCIQSLSHEDPEDPYYRKSWADRGIDICDRTQPRPPHDQRPGTMVRRGRQVVLQDGEGRRRRDHLRRSTSPPAAKPGTKGSERARGDYILLSADDITYLRWLV